MKKREGSKEKESAQIKKEGERKTERENR